LDHYGFNWKPNAQSWSAAQVVEHLNMVTLSYQPILRSVKDGSYRAAWTAWIPWYPLLIGKLLLRYSKPESKQKIRTFVTWEPATSELPLSTLDDFVKLQGELERFIARSSDLLVRKVVIGSPANRNLTYSLRNAFHIIVSHQERHLGQLQRVVDLRTNMST
jgi:hypothetical protein